MRRARCGASSRAAQREAPCRAHFGDPPRDYRDAARGAAQAHAVPVTLPDPATRRAAAARVRPRPPGDGAAPGQLHADYAALLPLLLHARARTRTTRRSPPSSCCSQRSYEDVADRHAQQRGVHRGRAVLRRRARIDRAALAATFMGAGAGRALREPVRDLAARAGRCGPPRAAAQRACRRCCCPAAMTR